MKILFFIGLSFCSLNAQTLKISNGITTSRLDWKINGSSVVMYDHYVSNYSVFIGVDWLQHKSFRIASSMGYLKKGGKDYQIQTDQLGNPVGTLTNNAKLEFISLNTTADFDIPLSKQLVYYFGGGPRIDILVNSPKALDAFRDNQTLNWITSGLLVETGIKYSFARYELGLQTNYYFNINNIVNWSTGETNLGAKITDRTFGFNLVLGYKL